MINIHDIIADTLVLGGASVIGMFLKMTLKPNEAEAKLIARMLIGFGMILMSLTRRWAHEHKADMDAILKTMTTLRDKVDRTKIGKGPVG